MQYDCEVQIYLLSPEKAQVTISIIKVIEISTCKTKKLKKKKLIHWERFGLLSLRGKVSTKKNFFIGNK